jgi:hypothetical protein
MRAGKLIPLAVVLMSSLLAAGCARRPAPVSPPAASVSAAVSELAPIPAWKDPTEKSVESDLYYGVYMMGSRKVGWQRIRRAKAEWEGEEAEYYLSETHLSIITLGSAVQQDTVQKMLVASDGRPLRAHYELPGRTVEAVFDEGEVRYESQIAGKTQGASLPIPEGADLRDPDLTGTPEEATVGYKAQYVAFEPLTLQLITANYSVEAQEKVTLDGKTHDCLRTHAVLTSGTEMTSWIDAKTHDMIQVNSPAASLEIRLEPKETAQKPVDVSAESGAMDLADETRVAVKTPISQPETRETLKLRITRVPTRKQMLSDQRQAWSDIVEEKGVLAGTLTIRRQPVPATVDASSKGPTEYTKPAPQIQSDDERIVAKAQELAPRGTPPAKAAEAIADWVRQTVRSDASVGGLRSATEVLEDPRGVCRDYAVLYAALARAAGIPTKFCAGCVYWNRGTTPGFYYHAWNEVYLPKKGGGGEWVAVDSTRPKAWPVDVTHLKFAEGEYGCMLDVVGLIGQLEIEVL